MAIELVKVMDKQPGVCFVCGSSPSREGHPIPAIDLNQDYDWGNNAYLCGECVSLIAGLAGFEPPDEVQKLQQKIELVKSENDELKAKLEEQEEDLSKIRDGSKAMKKVKATA